MSGMGWEVDPRPGHCLGEAEGCRQSAWEMVPSELITWGVQLFSLSVEVVGMVGWNAHIWARWDDGSGCPEGLFLHCKSCQGVSCEHNFPVAAVSALSRWVLLHWSCCWVPHLTPDACFNMVPVPLLHVIAQLSSAPVGRRCLGVGNTICSISTLLNFSTLYLGWMKTVVLPGTYNTAVNCIILDPYAVEFIPLLVWKYGTFRPVFCCWQ